MGNKPKLKAKLSQLINRRVIFLGSSDPKIVREESLLRSILSVSEKSTCFPQDSLILRDTSVTWCKQSGGPRLRPYNTRAPLHMRADGAETLQRQINVLHTLGGLQAR